MYANERDAREEKFLAVCAEMFSSGGWFMFPRKFLYFLSSDEALLLAYLINTARTVRAHERNEGWFYCRTTSIYKDLYIKRSKQTRMFALLKSKSLIKTEQRGLPAKRYIRINWKLLMRQFENVPEQPTDDTAPSVPKVG